MFVEDVEQLLFLSCSYYGVSASISALIFSAVTSFIFNTGQAMLAPSDWLSQKNEGNVARLTDVYDVLFAEMKSCEIHDTHNSDLT